MTTPQTRFLDGPDGQRLSPDEQTVLRVLVTHHIGADHACPMKTMAERTGIPARRCQAIVNSLIVDHLIPIGSSCRVGSHGWFLVESDDERAGQLAGLTERGAALMRRAKAFDYKHNERLRPYLSGQLEWAALLDGGRHG